MATSMRRLMAALMTSGGHIYDFWWPHLFRLVAVRLLVAASMTSVGRIYDFWWLHLLLLVTATLTSGGRILRQQNCFFSCLKSPQGPSIFFIYYFFLLAYKKFEGSFGVYGRPLKGYSDVYMNSNGGRGLGRPCTSMYIYEDGFWTRIGSGNPLRCNKRWQENGASMT